MAGKFRKMAPVSAPIDQCIKKIPKFSVTGIPRYN